MAQTQLKAEVRKEIAKNEGNKLRRQGIIPAILYGKKEKSIPLKINEKDFHQVLSTEAENIVIALKIKDENKISTKTVVLKETQHHPVSKNLLHIDFHTISLKEKLTTHIPLMVTGESPGVKTGGILEHLLWEIEVECLPTQIPEDIKVDISLLNIGDSISVRDLKPPEGVKILDDPEKMVLIIGEPAKIEEEVLPEEEITEPEVIGEKEKKKEEEKEEEKK